MDTPTTDTPTTDLTTKETTINAYLADLVAQLALAMQAFYTPAIAIHLTDTKEGTARIIVITPASEQKKSDAPNP